MGAKKIQKYRSFFNFLGTVVARMLKTSLRGIHPHFEAVFVKGGSTDDGPTDDQIIIIWGEIRVAHIMHVKAFGHVIVKIDAHPRPVLSQDLEKKLVNTLMSFSRRFGCQFYGPTEVAPASSGT